MIATCGQHGLQVSRDAGVITNHCPKDFTRWLKYITLSVTDSTLGIYAYA